MKADPYTPKSHGGQHAPGPHDSATAASTDSTRRRRRRSATARTRCASVRERYREAYAEALGQWQALRDELDAVDRGHATARPRPARPRSTDAADAAEAGADDARRRTLRGDVDR